MDVDETAEDFDALSLKADFADVEDVDRETDFPGSSCTTPSLFSI
jgi:hypothetical protein